MIMHKGYRDKWHTLSIEEQLGNVGSEFERALKSKKQGLDDRFEKAFMRFQELLNWTVEDKRHSLCRRRELARLREVINGDLYENPINEKSLEGFSRYFLAYGLMARRQTS